MFPLCSACVSTINQGYCTNSDEIFLVGTCVVVEVCKAVEIGYGLVNVLEF